MNKKERYLPHKTPTKLIRYSSVGPVTSPVENVHVSQNKKPKMRAPKRLKKQKFLSQLTAVGMIVWGGLLLLNFAIDSQFKSNAQVIFNSSSDINIDTSIEVQRLQRTWSEKGSGEQTETDSHTQRVKLQLQNIRMHNTLRASKSPKRVLSTEVNTHNPSSYKLTTQNDKLTKLRKNLIDGWEKDFTTMNN